jgi:hypothetical protein
MTLRILVLTAVCAVGSVQGQEYQYRSEVFGSVGYSSVADDEGRLGGGVSGGGGAGLRLSSRFGVEFDLGTLRNRRAFSGNSVEFAGHGFLASGSGLLYLRRGRVQPYLALGVGVLHYTSDNRFPDAPRVSRSGTGVAANAGLGTLIFVSPHVSLRPDLRLIAGRAGSTQVIEGPVMLRISFGLGYHW